MTEKDVMQILEDTLSSRLNMEGEGQWDSLDQVTILQKFDDVFEGEVDKIPQQELATMTTPKKVIDLLKKHKIIE